MIHSTLLIVTFFNALTPFVVTHHAFAFLERVNTKTRKFCLRTFKIKNGYKHYHEYEQEHVLEHEQEHVLEHEQEHVLEHV